MSVVIRGMKMPKSCDECPCYYETEGAWRNECEVLGKEYIADDYRPEWCPLVELPPHGRLIDAYELAIEILKLQKYRFSIEDPEIFVSRRMVMQAIKDKPAIIEAEEEQTTVCSATDCKHNVGGVCKKNAEEVSK